jgi:signal transduction histidine kinase
VIWLAVVVTAASLAISVLVAAGLRLIPRIGLQVAGLALLSVCLPLIAVLLSGWVMFHMGADMKILIVAAVSALGAVLAGVLLARSIALSLDGLVEATQRIEAGDLSARAPETGSAELRTVAASFNKMAASVEGLFDARRELVSWASHDLRTPVAAIRAMLEALNDGLAQPDEYLPAIEEQVRGLSLLIDDLFELAAIDSGALTLHLQATRLPDIVGSCLRAVDAQARSRQVQLESHIDAATPEIIAAPDKVERILLNLLNNALRHTPADGSVTVTVQPDHDGVCVAVEDTGEGLSPTAMQRGFERFWRADGARSRTDGGGAGLGLAIARGLVEAHAGSIWAEHRPGGGARVVFALPSNAEHRRGFS